MLNFTKTPYFKILALTVAATLCFESAVYGTDLSDLRHLRVPFCPTERMEQGCEEARGDKGEKEAGTSIGENASHGSGVVREKTKEQYLLLLLRLLSQKTFAFLPPHLFSGRITIPKKREPIAQEKIPILILHGRRKISLDPNAAMSNRKRWPKVVDKYRLRSSFQKGLSLIRQFISRKQSHVKRLRRMRWQNIAPYTAILVFLLGVMGCRDVGSLGIKEIAIIFVVFAGSIGILVCAVAIPLIVWKLIAKRRRGVGYYIKLLGSGNESKKKAAYEKLRSFVNNIGTNIEQDRDEGVRKTAIEVLKEIDPDTDWDSYVRRKLSRHRYFSIFIVVLFAPLILTISAQAGVDKESHKDVEEFSEAGISGPSSIQDVATLEHQQRKVRINI